MKRLLFLALMVWVGCTSGGNGASGGSGGSAGTNSGTTGSTGSVTQVQVMPMTLNLQVGQTGQLTAQAFDGNHNMLDVPQSQFNWVSRTPADVRVSSSGQVTAVAQGSSDIAATYMGVPGVGTVIVGAGGTNGTSGSNGTTGAPMHTLTVVVIGNGAVSSDTGGISCGASTGNDCSASYSSGTLVTLNTQAFNGSTFQGWSGATGCVDGASCGVSIQGDMTVTATFTAACANPPGCTWFDGGACPPACCANDWSCGGNMGGTSGSKVCRVIQGNATVPSGSYCVDAPQTQTFCNDDSSCLFGDVCALVRDGSGCPCTDECMAAVTAGLPARASCGPDAGDCTSGLCLDDGTGPHCAWLCPDNPFDVNACDGGALLCLSVPRTVASQCAPPPGDFRIAHVGKNPVANLVGASVVGTDQVLVYGKSDLALEFNAATNLFDFNGSSGVNDPRAPSFSSGAMWLDGFSCLLDDDGGSVSCGPLNSNFTGPPQLNAGVLVASGARALARGVNDAARLYILDGSGVSISFRSDAGDLGAPVSYVAGSVDLLGTRDDGTLIAASSDGHVWVDGGATVDVPLASATVNAVTYGSEPIAVDSRGIIYRLPSPTSWLSSTNFTIPNSTVAAADEGDNLLVGGPDGLWAGSPSGSFERVWRGIVFVGFVPGAPDGGTYEVAIDQNGYLLIRP